MENTVQLLNRIELTGIVGNVHRMTVAGDRLVRVNVCTTYAYYDRDMRPAVESTWLQCLICAPEERPEFIEELKEGMLIHLKGRIRMDRYTTPTGMDTVCPLVIVAECQVTPSEGMVIEPENA